MREAAVVNIVESWLIGQGYETRLELQWRPFAYTDIVARKDGEYVAIEVKVSDWRRALQQAVCQGKAFDKVYIAALYNPASGKLPSVLEDGCPWTNWVGILGVTVDGLTVLRQAMPKPGRRSEFHRAIVEVQFLASSRMGQAPFSSRPPLTVVQ